MASVSELKARLAKMNRSTGKNTDIFKPKDEHDVRLLRNPHKDDPFEEVTFHFNVGDAREILCPKQWGDECAICDFAEGLKAWKNEKGEDKPKEERQFQFNIFRKIQAQTKMYVPMVERTEGSVSAPAWWGLTNNQSQQVLKVCTEPEWLEDCGIDPSDDEKALDAIFSPSKAYDLHISVKKPGEKGNTKQFYVIDIGPSGKRPKPLTGNKEKDKELIDAVKPIREVFPKIPAAEVEAALAKFIGGGMKVEQPKADAKDEKYKSATKEKADKSGTRDVDEAFGELLENS